MTESLNNQDWSFAKRAEPVQANRPHEQIILEALQEHGPLVPGQLMDMTGIARNVIAKITRILHAQKRIVHVRGKGWALP